MNLELRYKNISLKKLKLNENKNFLKILEIRNEENVRKNMYTQEIIEKKAHLIWIKKQIKNKTCIFYKIYFEDKLIGLLILSKFNKAFTDLEWAFYITKKIKAGIGSLVEYKFLNQMFKKNVKIIKCEVLEFNEAVISLHKKFGFKIIGKKINQFAKENKFRKAVILELNRKNWQNYSKIFKSRFGF